ncbi:hypothetical protein DFQ07_3169 [Tenacibaculum caenipelagi]|uniref:Uncharacterized protein n=1 Tax=Tenacibaculum caenipelagi TaxID=1325435 RepID=A0A4V6PW72_9FLAO|nr:hypothetical protein DFQ07_3169 [Tenacibaculum caenipelagi]
MTDPEIVDVPDYKLEGCNTPWPENLTTDWTDNCSAGGQGILSDGGVDQPDSEDGCTQYRLYTFTVTDDCGNSDTETTLVSRDYDMTDPEIVDVPDYKLEGCNTPWPENLTTDWTDNCSAGGQGILSDGGVDQPDSEDGCTQYRLYTFTVTDDCGNSDTETTLVSRDYDMTDPVITDLPESYEICDAELPEVLNAKWTDNCATGGDLIAYPTNQRTEGCAMYADYVFTATDDCGNSVTETVTLGVKMDLFENCGTAFARGNDYTCFLDDGFNRWGWTNYFETEGVYTIPLYTGAAQCDTSNGAQSGEVTITYQDGYVSVEYNLYEGYVMSVAHVYIGCEKYPIKNGKETVAPGQYNFSTSKLDYVSNYTVGPIEASGPIYIIAHAVTCEEVCRCHESVDNNGTFTPEGSVHCEEQAIETVQQQEQSNFSAYPVPFRNEITIEYEYKFDTDVAIEFYSMNGILIKRIENDSYIKGTQEQIKVDLSDVQNQALIVRLITDRGIVNKKIIAMRPKKRK